ncbi:hypothetical protein R3H94_004918 [Salmonella enterica]|nr:hypothetical protein [Salmonella enterica]EIT1648907.1 hypothetical protein [Salmonella enterica]EKC7695842.1 hypothetical protein [Salmonella enterica]ELR0265516.1 hypothetical protein [Salmonella enterica]ELR0567209.1 hypothetical protein [Salmonella enterica]
MTEKSGHLAWCAMVALALARQDGGLLSPAQEKAGDCSEATAFFGFEWLLKQGRQLNYSWRSSTDELSEQNAAVR